MSARRYNRPMRFPVLVAALSMACVVAVSATAPERRAQRAVQTRPVPPQALPPDADMTRQSLDQDTTRQSPPASAATERGELPGGSNMER